MGLLNYKNDSISGEEGFLRGFLINKDKPLVLDVGANVGRYAQMVLDFNPSTRLHCFEPHPATFSRLQTTFAGTRSAITLVNKGVGIEQSTLELYDYSAAGGTSHASIYKEVIEALHDQKAEAVSVEIIDLKSYLTTNSISRVDLLKIDTEGNELNVLKGLGALLHNGTIGAIHFEFNEMNVLSRSTFRDFWELLIGFKVYRLLPGGKMLPIDRYIPLECELFAYQNIVAFRA